MRKIVELVAEAAQQGEKCVSFEFFPPSASKAEGSEHLFARIAEMGERLKPTFVSLTWRSGFKDESLWLQLGSRVQKQLGIVVLLHLTCHLPRNDLLRVLSNARAAGIRNILALRGDSAHFAAGSQVQQQQQLMQQQAPVVSKPSRAQQGQQWGACSDGFTNAIELVHLIRAEHGDHFCVGVAGYPEVHTACWNSELLPPSAQARELDLQRLKDKVDAGADFVITQFTYDAELYFAFQRRCRAAGIQVPILAGYAPIQNYASFQRFRSWVRAAVPGDTERVLALVKDNDEEVRATGVELGVRQCGLLLKGEVAGIHFFTLNLAGTVAHILSRLKLRDPDASHQARELPFRGLIRDREEIRPIFWQHRHASYLSRTSTWEEFPNGRWGDSRSATTFELADYYLAEKRRSAHDLRAMWGVPQCEGDVADVFVRYMRGAITQLPWCDQDLALETEAISESLCWINQHGFLTINSQPKVNGVSSSDPRYGWGGPGGVCFQKAYVEFFCSPAQWFKLRDCVDACRGRISYHAIDFEGEEYLDSEHDEGGGGGGGGGGAPSSAEALSASGNGSSASSAVSAVRLRKLSGLDDPPPDAPRPHRVNAVTWGVFPGREIIQPTVVDTESFRVWKDEAFELWLSQWQSIYRAGEAEATPPQSPAELQSLDSDTASDSEEALRRAQEQLQEIHDTWFLVNLVDNDYVSEQSDIFESFSRVILDQMAPLQLRDRVDALEKENASLFRQLLKAQAALAEERKRNDRPK